MALVINNKFNFGQTVYLITDKDQLPRMVVSISIRPGEIIWYGLCHGTLYSEHYEMEVSETKDVLITVT